MNSLLALLHPQVVYAPQLAIALGVILLALLHGFLADRRKFKASALTLSTFTLIAAALAGFSVAMAGPVEWVLVDWGWGQLSILLDALSCIMLGLVGFLGYIVTRFSLNYLEGDPGQQRFIQWLCATQGSVVLLVISGNLLLFIVSWMAISLCLHQLLTFYPDRPGAKQAAKKKFLISRLGDACLISAALLVWLQFKSLDFSVILAPAAAAKQPLLPWIAGLLVAAAIIKSAQFPFHSWLPDTLETPTPVSALMHAGIINAGGYLILRMSPLLVQVPGALNTLAFIGAFTALFASVIMMTQSSVKKSLAWSTVSQMGFMMLQCGLGAFALAMLHVVAHSLYKAYAFLSSGSSVRQATVSWVPTSRPAAHPKILIGALLAALMIGCGTCLLLVDHVMASPGELLLAAVFVMALAHLLWTLWSSSMRRRLLTWGLAIAGLTAVTCFTLHAAFSSVLQSALPLYHPERTALDFILMSLVMLLFLAVLVFQAQLPAWGTHPRFSRLYVHAANGFYFGTYLNRFTQKLGL
ncbi:NAD(P)H-quinone oxidoreductase subunit 5 [Prosthecobacter debontii]|uniref:Probable inorganic carbon transporter subunit DabB n=1 Tax=Prosthecobacter debontii TaxID=48467 RepID=A0A1T4XGM0_9BACT|nr:NADH-quinone oxidoreductase subunit L [Prosthecobacter debontii]SKA88567.1 NAD(P)H-quinone oxidoreductase subunit 5 [Prosthecobacter debontii]